MERLVILILVLPLGLAIIKLRSTAAKERKAVLSRLALERSELGDYSPTAELFKEVGVQHDPNARLPRNVPPPPAASDPVLDQGWTLEPLVAEPPAEPKVESPEPPEDLTSEDLTSEDLTSEELLPHLDLDPEPDLGDLPPPAEGDLRIAAGDLRTLFRGISMPAGLRPLGPLQPENASFATSTAAAAVRQGLDTEFSRLGCTVRWVEPTVAQTERNGERGLVTIYPDPASAVDLDGRALFPGLERGQVVVRMLAL